MEFISRAIERLPVWAKGVLGVLVVIGCIYSIARDGFLMFLLKVIFSP